MATLPSNLKVTRNSVKDLQRSLALLPRRELLVGFPEETATRDEAADPEGHPLGPITNAVLAYIHDNGAPERNIPARSFMVPGMDAARGSVISILSSTARAVLTRKDPDIVEKGFTRAGIVVQASIRSVFTAGIPPPLAESTLQARARKGQKGARQELDNRAQGMQPSTEFVKPLIESGQLRRAVNFVIRAKRRKIG